MKDTFLNNSSVQLGTSSFPYIITFADHTIITFFTIRFSTSFSYLIYLVYLAIQKVTDVLKYKIYKDKEKTFIIYI